MAITGKQAKTGCGSYKLNLIFDAQSFCLAIGIYIGLSLNFGIIISFLSFRDEHKIVGVFSGARKHFLYLRNAAMGGRHVIKLRRAIIRTTFFPVL